MAGKLTFDPVTGEILHTAGARKVWSDTLSPALILPATNTIEATVSIGFPDFNKGNVQFFGYVSNAPFPGESSEARSWGVIRAGEWGPDAAGAFNLPRQFLGFVPAAANNLEVTVMLTNTVVPSQFFYAPVVKILDEGVAVDLDGGCTILEGRAGWRRIIRVVKLDGAVYLERFQSVGYSAVSVPTGFKSGAQSWSGGALGPWANQWTHDGDPTGWMSYDLGGTGVGGNINKARGGPNPPPTYDPSNFASTWAGTIVVRPTIVRT